MVIRRDWYLQKLIERRNNGLIKIVTGIRRCGKSFLLFTLFQKYLLKDGLRQDQIIALALDDEDHIALRDPDKLYAYLKSRITDTGIPYVILLDEVQFAISEAEFKKGDSVRLYGVLNGLLRLPNVDIYVTGSNSKLLSKDVLTEFRGRGDEIHLNPLTFSEFMSVYEGSKYEGWNAYMLYGGLPQVVLQKTDEGKRTLLEQLLKETYIRDLTGRHRIRNKEEFEELMEILASGIGSLTNPRKLSDTFLSVKKTKISNETVRNYIEYLSDAFLISSARRYDIKGKKYIDSPFKYYYADLGLRNAELNFRQIEETHIMENVIYNELRARGYAVDVGIVETFAKNEKGSNIRRQVEVDFVCNKAPQRWYIQSAFALPDREKTLQEERPLLGIRDAFRKMIIVKDTAMPWYTEEGVLVISLYDFLLDKDVMK